MIRMSLFAALALLLGFSTSCEKGAVEDVADEATAVNEGDHENAGSKDVGGGGRTFCICTGYKVGGSAGDLDCDQSGDNCTKLLACPCPDKSGGKKVSEEDILALDDAIESEQIPSFFNEGDHWKKLFPRLKDDQESLSDLRNGELTLVVQNDGQDETLSYAAVYDDKVSGENVGPSDVQFCLTRSVIK